MSPSLKLRCIVIVAATMTHPFAAQAHPGPHHDIERLTIALGREGGRLDLLVQRGQAYRLAGDFEASLRDFDRARGLAGENRVLSLERGLTLAAMRRDCEAEAALSHHLVGPYPTADAFVERARIRQRAGRDQLAIDDYSAAISLKPDVESYIARGELFEKLKRLDDAAAGYREGLERCYGAIAIRLALIRVETARGDFAAATGLIDEAARTSSSKTDWLLRRAAVRRAARDEAGARSDLEHALAEANRGLARRPTALNLLLRAKVFSALGRRSQAETDLRAARKKSPALTEAAELLIETGSRQPTQVGAAYETK